MLEKSCLGMRETSREVTSASAGPTAVIDRIEVEDKFIRIIGDNT